MHFHHWKNRERRGRDPFVHGLRRHGRGGSRGRLGRLLEHGDLRFVLLALIAEQPRHGYDLIRELEARSGGAYRPSPGVIYPTLALLEDEGLVRQTGGDAGRKLYETTEAGRTALQSQRPSVDAVFARLAEAAAGSERTRPRIARAMGNLSLALQHRLDGRPIAAADLDAIVAIIDEAAAAVEKV